MRAVSKLRALVVEPAGQLWGSERALLDFIDSAPMLRFSVCCPPATPIIELLARRGVRTFPWIEANLHQKSRLHRLRAAFAIFRACRAARPDVIHLNQSGAFRIARPAAKLLHIPILAHVRIYEDAAYLASCAPDLSVLKGIVAISDSIASEARIFPSLAKIETRRIYDAYAMVGGDGAEERPRRIACVGRVAPSKGQELLLDSMRQLGRAWPDVECVILGGGDSAYVEQLRQASPTNVKWAGVVREVMPVLRACSVLVLPSHREALGRVIFEAWDAGAVPVVFAGSGGAAEVVEAANGGFMYQEQTPGSLSEVLDRALAMDATDRGKLVSNGRAWMRQNNSLPSYCAHMSELIRSVTNR